MNGNELGLPVLCKNKKKIALGGASKIISAVLWLPSFKGGELRFVLLIYWSPIEFFLSQIYVTVIFITVIKVCKCLVLYECFGYCVIERWLPFFMILPKPKPLPTPSLSLTINVIVLYLWYLLVQLVGKASTLVNTHESWNSCTVYNISIDFVPWTHKVIFKKLSGWIPIISSFISIFVIVIVNGYSWLMSKFTIFSLSLCKCTINVLQL